MSSLAFDASSQPRTCTTLIASSTVKLSRMAKRSSLVCCDDCRTLHKAAPGHSVGRLAANARRDNAASGPLWEKPHGEALPPRAGAPSTSPPGRTDGAEEPLPVAECQ